MPADTTTQAGLVVGQPELNIQPVSEKQYVGDEKTVPALEDDLLSPDEGNRPHRIGGHAETDIEVPTHDELHGHDALRRVSAPIPWAAYTIAFVELCERFSYYGTTAVFSNFINHSLPNGSLEGSNPKTGAGGGSSQGISGALGRGPQASNGIITFNQFWVYTIPLFAAYLADEHWGRYKTICVSLAIAIIGHIVLVISAIPGVIDKNNTSLGVFLVGLIIMGLGTGGFKPNISPLVVEQIPLTTLAVQVLPTGERVIVDPTITQSRIYHYFYLFINIGALIGQLGMVYAEKYVGFWLAFFLPTVLFAIICPGIMWWGRKRYMQAPPQGSVLSKSMKLFIKANKGRWSINPVRTYHNLHDGTFWSAVKPSAIKPEDRPSWYTFDDAWVDEVRRGFAACAVFTWYPLFWITYNQINNNLITQAGTMQLHGLPSDVLNNIDPIALMILIPLLDRVIYPWLRKRNILPTPIKRITCGFIIGALAMLWAAIIQWKIYSLSPCGYQANGCTDSQDNVLPAPIHVGWQTGCYLLIAISEIFASITSLEYAFSKAPISMRSMVQAVSLFTSAIAAAIGEALNPLSGDPLLIWNYGVMGVLASIGGVLFYLQFKTLDRAEDELNMLNEGNVIATKEVAYIDPHAQHNDEIKI